ncbi:MAG: PGPGW domain-containing protein [bacterium]
MGLESSILALSIPAVVMSILGTVVTILCIVYRRQIASYYFDFRSRWHSRRDSFPKWFLLFLKLTIGLVGFSLIVAGIILMPLPGPGAVIVIAGAGLLDLEFGWIVPFLQRCVNLLPDRWTPKALQDGLANLKETNSDSEKD